MRRLLSILLFACFAISLVCVPEGDFSLLSQLPTLYHHCKETEDIDMNFIDFITDHLINIDGIFDKHLPGDNQKPHQPFQFHNVHEFVYVASYIQTNLTTPVHQLKKSDPSSNNSFHSDFLAYVFHPPDHS